MQIGARVRVPFGPRRLIGTVVQWPALPPDEGVELKPIESVLRDPRRRLTPQVLELTRFLADYYLCSWGEAIEAALPPEPGPDPRPDHVRRLPLADEKALPARAAARRRLLLALPTDGRPIALADLDASGRRAIPALRKQGWVELVRSSDAGEAAPSEAPEPIAAPYPLTPGQTAVLKRLVPSIASREYAPWLLFGALLSIPLLVLRGEHSDLLSTTTLEKMQQQKPDLKAVIVRNRGHAPYLDEPEATDAIDLFLANY